LTVILIVSLPALPSGRDGALVLAADSCGPLIRIAETDGSATSAAIRTAHPASEKRRRKRVALGATAANPRRIAENYSGHVVTLAIVAFLRLVDLQESKDPATEYLSAQERQH
jgi:hypothetical protein